MTELTWILAVKNQYDHMVGTQTHVHDSNDAALTSVQCLFCRLMHMVLPFHLAGHIVVQVVDAASGIDQYLRMNNARRHHAWWDKSLFHIPGHLLQAAAKHGVLSKLSKHNWQILLAIYHTTITYQLCWQPTCLVHKFAELVWIVTFACCRYFPFFCKLGRPVWQYSYPSCLLACVKSFCCFNCRHVCMCTW